ncbi:hypothetical protein [Erwinia phage FBB1]|nr:hypothetical protein [Erwinia phage FBB1]
MFGIGIRENTVEDVRDEFSERLAHGVFSTDKTGVKTLEILNASFIASEDSIFGKVNLDYVKRELEWYDSGSLNVYDIPGGTPEIWEKVSSRSGEINSNYGWAIYSEANGSQYDNVLKELIANQDTRRAQMIYTRPSMHSDYNRDGMSDFMCTSNVQYFIRDGILYTHVYMRSNDSVFGYRNDWHWQKTVATRLVDDLVAAGIEVELGDIYWNAASLHVYSRHFYLVDHYLQTGDNHVLKKDYKGEYA